MDKFMTSAVLVLLLAAFCSSCGGGKGGAEALLSNHQDVALSGSDNVEFSIDRSASKSAFGVKRVIKFTYSLDG